MKTPPFLLIGCPVIIVAAGLVYAFTHPALSQTPFHAALIEAQQPLPAESDTNNTPVGSPDARAQRMNRMMDQLGLSDAQKQQIAQIRQTITDRQQRREAIRNVLTPDQRAKWQQLREAQRNGRTPPPAPAVPTNGT